LSAQTEAIKNLHSMRYIIVDDNKEELERTHHLLTLVDGTQLCMKSGYYKGIVSDIHRLRPQVLFLEIELNVKDGFQIVNELSALGFTGKVVITTSQRHYTIKAIRSGVFDFLQKPIDIDDLKATIKRIRNGHCSNKENSTTEIMTQLSEREKDIVIQLKMGKTSKEIGELLAIKKNTVDTHRRRILEKTGCESTNELIRKVEF
jgi:FixJ family two-component response regulator